MSTLIQLLCFSAYLYLSFFSVHLLYAWILCTHQGEDDVLQVDILADSKILNFLTSSCKNAVVEMIGGLGVNLEKSLEVDSGSELTEEYLQVTLPTMGSIVTSFTRVKSTQWRAWTNPSLPNQRAQARLGPRGLQKPLSAPLLSACDNTSLEYGLASLDLTCVKAYICEGDTYFLLLICILYLLIHHK